MAQLLRAPTVEELSSVSSTQGKQLPATLAPGDLMLSSDPQGYLYSHVQIYTQNYTHTQY
jgi:cell wall-associated NlpC family hydrolase